MLIDIDDIRGVVYLGVQGEHKVIDIDIDCTSWVDEYPNGILVVEAQRPNENTVYIADSSTDDNIITWHVRTYDTYIAGCGSFQVKLNNASGQNIKISPIIHTKIEPSQQGMLIPTPPVPVPSWVDDVLEAAETAVEAADDAEDSAEAAETSADAAAQSAQDIEDLTVTSHTLPVGSTPTVTKTKPAGQPYKLDFGLPTTEQAGKVDDVKVDGTSVVSGRVANIDLTGKQPVIQDLDTIRSGAAKGATSVQPNDNVSTLTNDAGYINKSVNNLDNYSTTTAMNQAIQAHHDSSKQDSISDLANIRAGATLGSTSIQPDDNVSKLTNDTGFITKAVNNLENYSTTTVMNQAIAGHHDDTKQDTITDLQTIREGAEAGATALQTDDNVSELTNDAGYITKEVNNLTNYSTTSAMNTAISNHHDNTKVNTSSIGVAGGVAELDSNGYVIGVETVDNVSSAGSTKPLTANQGKILNDRIDSLEGRGRFLANWDCTTGYPDTLPGTSPYQYKSGDYYIVNNVGTTNYKPDGTTFVTGTHSTVVESQEVMLDDEYWFDSNTWKLHKTGRKITTFGNISGDPYDNTNLASALNNKSKVGVSASGTSTNKVTYITVDGTEYKMADEPTEQTVKLAEDLYTYVNIGKITGASQTNPIKVADQGDPLKDVFNAILGTEVDVNPTINQGGTTFTKSGQTGTTAEGGGEIGRTINAQTGTVTFTVTNTGTCTYGLKAGSYDTYSKTSATTFNYPIKTRTVEVGGTTYSYQIKIEYPTLNGCTLTVTAGTLVKNDINGRILYCNVDNQNKVTVSIAMPASASTGSAQTRFNQLNADVDFDSATYQGTVIDNFWTYLKAVYNNGKTHSAITNVKSTSYVINAGAYYTYYKVTNDTTASSTGWTSVNSTSISDITVSASVGQYIWFASTQNKTAIYEWNDVSGKYNSDATATTKASGQTIHTNTGQDVTSYYTYRTTNGRSGATNKKFKLA